jgi:hypothetical protein
MFVRGGDPTGLQLCFIQSDLRAPALLDRWFHVGTWTHSHQDSCPR